MADLSLLLGEPVEVAPRLLGAMFTHLTGEGAVTVRLTEVEAYAGAGDPGSHAYRGRTRRTEVMFGPAGHLYVYFTYGMHHCCNVVVGEEGVPGAVLLRAGEIVDGLDLARSRRGSASDRDLARGPARLCRALGIDLAQNGEGLNGEGLSGEGLLAPLSLVLGDPAAPDRVRSGPRVGLRAAPERPWRFWLDGEPSVSPYRPAAPRRARG